jgi:hypothetical protein
MIPYILLGCVVIFILYKLFNKSKGESSKMKKSDEGNLDDYYKRKIEIFKSAQKVGLVAKEIRIKSNNSSLIVPKIGSYDGLVGWAAYIFITSEDKSTSHVQRMMSVNYERAYACTEALLSLGIIKETGTKQYSVLISDLNKIKEILGQE